MRTGTVRRGKQAGFILFLTILLIAVLAVFAVEFSYLMRVRASQVENRRDDLAALMGARGGIEAARKVLAEDDSSVDHLGELWASAAPPLPYGDERGLTVVSIVDENSKLSLNELVKRDSKGKETLNKLLLAALGRAMEEMDGHSSTANAIVDWLDGDKAPRGDGGAEAGYYMGLDPPYRPADGPVYAVEELLLVRGITSDVFHGDPEQERIGLRDYLSVYGNAINVNTASRDVLVALFEDEAIPDRIIAERKTAPFESIAAQKKKSASAGQDFQSRVPELDKKAFSKVKGVLTVGSTYFRVYSRGMVGSATREVEAVVRKQKSGVKVVYYRVMR